MTEPTGVGIVGVVAAFDTALWRTGYAILEGSDLLAGGSIGSGRSQRRDARAVQAKGGPLLWPSLAGATSGRWATSCCSS